MTPLLALSIQRIFPQTELTKVREAVCTTTITDTRLLTLSTVSEEGLISFSQSAEAPGSSEVNRWSYRRTYQGGKG